MTGQPSGEGAPGQRPAAPEGQARPVAVRAHTSPDAGGAPSARARRRHRILVTAIALSPLVALVILVVLLLRTIEQRAASTGDTPAASAPARPAAPGE